MKGRRGRSWGGGVQRGNKKKREEEGSGGGLSESRCGVNGSFSRQLSIPQECGCCLYPDKLLHGYGGGGGGGGTGGGFLTPSAHLSTVTRPQNALPCTRLWRLRIFCTSFWTCSMIAVCLMQLILQLISSSTRSFNGTASPLWLKTVAHQGIAVQSKASSAVCLP